MTEEIRTCDHCGAKVVEYHHALSKLLVNALVKFHKEFGQNEANLKNSSLTFNERTNFQKLKYWELVFDGPYHSTWCVSPIGELFLNGCYALRKQAITFRGKLKKFDGEKVFFKDVTGYSYDRKGDYIRNSHPIGQCRIDIIVP